MVRYSMCVPYCHDVFSVVSVLMFVCLNAGIVFRTVTVHTRMCMLYVRMNVYVNLNTPNILIKTVLG